LGKQESEVEQQGIRKRKSTTKGRQTAKPRPGTWHAARWSQPKDGGDQQYYLDEFRQNLDEI
jgi:hypothetical protein